MCLLNQHFIWLLQFVISISSKHKLHSKKARQLLKSGCMSALVIKRDLGLCGVIELNLFGVFSELSWFILFAAGLLTWFIFFLPTWINMCA
jgi:hypothetical protein